jgi:hypothetical protein
MNEGEENPMKPSDSFDPIKNNNSDEQETVVNWNNLLGFWTGRTWPSLSTADTSRAAEHAFEAWRTLFTANQAATEVLYNTARRQQELAFNLARTTFDTCSPDMIEGGAQQPNALWKRMMAGYAEGCNAGLEITQVMTSATFEALQRAPGLVTHGRTDGASAS